MKSIFSTSVFTNFSTVLMKSVFLAGLLIGSIVNAPAVHAGSYDVVNRQPAATCQIAAGFMVNEALDTLRAIKIGSLILDFINPVSKLNPLSKKKKNKGMKAITRILIAVAVASAVTCPPIVMPAPFRGLSRNTRVNIALATGFNPRDPDMILDVTSPGSASSCSTRLVQKIDTSSGRVRDFGDFPEMEFVYAEPFGSYPSVTKLLRDLVAQRVQEIMDKISGLLPSNILPSLPFDNVTNFVDDAISVPDELNPSLGDVIPGFDLILDSIFGFVAVGFEGTMNDAFNGWNSEILKLPLDRMSHSNIGDGFTEFEFRDGVSEYKVIADNQSSPLPAHLKFNYTQRVFVNEYFRPDFNVLYEIEDPNNPGTMLRIVADGEYEALEPGRADRSYTPPTSFDGTLEATDNCDPDPQEFIQIPVELRLGIHYFPITAIDRAGNESELFHVRINVVDSIPPDVNPPESIGIEVPAGTQLVNFTDPGIGCTTYLCQNNLPDRQVYPPSYFDFATITPTYSCFASNTLGSDQPCDLAGLPVGEATEIRWEATDPSGNIENIIQHVAIREAGVNLPPTAEGTAVTVASGITTPIPLQASDPEFDPLSWRVNSLPLNGQLEVTPDAQFQTRFSLTGTMDKMSSIVKLEGCGGGSFCWDRVLLADEGNHRLLEIQSFGGSNEPTVFFTHFLGNVKPSSILLYDFDNSNNSLQNEPYLNELLLADWSTGRIHTLLGPDHSPDAGYDISPWINNPSQIALQRKTGYALLFITEPDAVDSAQGKLVVLRINNFDPTTTADTWAISHEATLALNSDLAGFNADAITATECGLLLMSDTDAPGAGGGARMATFEYIDPNNHGFDRQWDVSSLAMDPPGDARPLLGQRIELAGQLNGNCSTYDVYVADDASKEVFSLRLDADSSIQTGTAIKAGTEFVTILNIEAPAQDRFFVMTESRLARYDINGVLDALVLIAENSSNGHNFNQLFPAGDMWIDMDLANNGTLFMLNYGSPDSGSSTMPTVIGINVNPGFNEFDTVVNEQSAQQLERAWAVSFNPGATPATGDDRVLLASGDGLESLNANDLGSSNLLLAHFWQAWQTCDWCSAVGFDDTIWGGILDLVSDGDGNVYFSDSFNRVHKFTSAGSYVGWLGRCDSGSNCDTANGNSTGFSCTVSTCEATPTAGIETSQFDFEASNSANLISSRRPRYGHLMVDDQAGLLYVSDYPDHDSDPTTPRLPRLQSFSLASGAFNSETVPDGQPGNLLSFLDPGDFTDINDMAVFGSTFYVAEDLPLERLHVFDVNAFGADLNGAFVSYISNPDYAGMDFFDYSVKDSFGAGSALAMVDINVVIDTEAPQLTCPADIIIEGTHAGGAKASNFVQAMAGSVVLAEFLRGYDVSDNVTVPPPTASDDAPSLLPLGDTLVTFTAIDGVGNQSSCSAMVTVIDTVAPEIAQPADLQVEATAALTFINLPQPAASDQVGPLTVTASPLGPYPLGTTEVVWTAMDSQGNQASVRQLLLVADTVAPLFDTPPPFPDQEAVNGYGNSLNYSIPAVFDAVGLNDSAGCMPKPGSLVSSVVVDIYCQAVDTSTNFSSTRFSIKVVQSDDDFDGISNLVDPTPATADGQRLFSDIPLGGRTEGHIIDANGFDVSVSDAWLEEQGVRIEVQPLVVQQLNKSGGQKKQGAVTGEPVELEACNDELHISGLVDGVDADGFAGSGIAIIACEPFLAIAEVGSLNLSFPAPGDELVHIHLSSGNGIGFDGIYYRAPVGNTEPVIVSSPTGAIIVRPGALVAAVGLLAVPMINIWGLLGLLVLFSSIAIRELRRRQINA